MTGVTTKRFTTEEYHRLAEVGIVTEDDRLELIEGEIVKMAAMGSKHASCVNELAALFIGQVGHAARVTIQTPVRLNDYLEPEPDIALVVPRSDRYANGHPVPSEVFLIVEVGDSSAAYDREVKTPLYARAGIPEVWLIDLIEDSITLYSELRGGEYRLLRRARRGDRVVSTRLPELAVEVDAILGSMGPDAMREQPESNGEGL